LPHRRRTAPHAQAFVISRQPILSRNRKGIKTLANDKALCQHVLKEKGIQDFRKDLEARCDLVADESTDLLARFPHGGGQTILREALLAAGHYTYHVGEAVLLRRILGAWH